MISTKKIGDRAVAGVLARLLKKEAVILLPFGDSQRYDLATETNGKFKRIECKTGRLKNGSVNFSTSSTEWYGRRNKDSKLSGHGRKNYLEDTDLFGVYCPESDEAYLVPVEDVPTVEASLRIDETKNGQKKGIRWAKDYKI